MHPARKFLIFLFVFLAFVGGGVFMYFAFQGSRVQPQHATVLPSPLALPEFALTDHSGNAFTRSDLRENWHVLFFGFTNCPDICPATLQQLSIARSRLAEAGNAFPEIILVSVDPERDTPEAMAAYVSHFDADIRGVTGTVEELRKLTTALGVFFEKSGNAVSYSVDHTAAVMIIDKDASWQAVFGAPHSIDKFVHDIPILTGES